MNYSRLMPLDPPRATKAVPLSMIDQYQEMGWYCQVKKNGAYSVIYVSPDRELVALNRHQQPHKAWQFTAASSEIFRKLPKGGWYVFCAELMHSKVPGIRDINYIHDVMVAGSRMLHGHDYARRYKLLQDIFMHPDVTPGDSNSHWVIDEHTWLARNLRSKFTKVYADLGDPRLDEGLVLKNPKVPLGVKVNDAWSVKVRRPTKNFGFSWLLALGIPMSMIHLHGLFYSGSWL